MGAARCRQQHTEVSCQRPPPPKGGALEGKGTSEAAPEAVGGGCQSGLGRLLSVTNAIGVRRQWLGIGWAPWGGGAHFLATERYLWSSRPLMSHISSCALYCLPLCAHMQ